MPPATRRVAALGDARPDSVRRDTPAADAPTAAAEPPSPASPRTARALNDRLALRLLQSEGPLTAGRLKELTGLSRPTIADLVERLRQAGLVHVVGETGTRRRGPNARLYAIVADRAHLAAVDVRLNSVGVVVADLLGTTLAAGSMPIDAAVPTAGRGVEQRVEPSTEHAVEQAVALVEQTARRAEASRLHSVCVGAPGLIDPVSGELRPTTGLPSWHRQFVAALQKRLPATVLVENETNLAAMAEQKLGAARDSDTFVMIWPGAGVGAAVVLDGRVRRGASGGAGELGFLPVPGTGGLPSADACEGGLHSLVGGAAVVELAAGHGLFPDAETEEPPSASVVRTAVATHTTDPAADRFLDELARRLALATAAVAAVLDPGRVVLGAELGHAGGSELAARVEAHAAALSPLRTQVRATELGGEAVLRGALLAAQQAAQDALFPSGR
ncbi:MAG TPA: ROK family transcriptional regulator [Yinghuangia sp.]|nr:ROK family transcriptional regulator [Yinghuangia sp.]